MTESRCGIKCSQCAYKEQMNCKGCVNISKPFWGESCPVKSCCEGKQLEHCGHCEEFPCELLKQFSYDEKEGDGGRRIDQCRCWKVENDCKLDWLDEFLQSFKGVTRDYKEEWDWIRYMVGGKMFAALCKTAKNGEGLYDILTIKLEVLEGEFLRQQYEDIIPGYYMNKQHWNSVYLAGELSEELLKDLTEKSYKLVLGGLSKKAQNAIANGEL